MDLSTSYRVVATGRRPLFICKAIVAPAPPEMHHTPPKLEQIQVRSPFKNLQQKIKVQQETVRLNNLVSRSISCDLKSEENPMRTSIHRDNKDRKAKSIKQYLILAYKRNEKLRRVDYYKLPEITKEKKEIYSAQKELEKTVLEKVSTMRHMLKRNKNNERPKFNSQEKEQNNGRLTFKSDYLSGWEDDPNVEQF